MENPKKLELTLCGMLPYGLKAECLEADGWNEDSSVKIRTKIRTVFDVKLKWGIITDKKGIMGNKFKDFKPLLHSMDKLTEPILENGLIPIVELYKIAVERIYNYVPEFDIVVCDYEEPTFGLVVKEKEDGNRNGFTLNIPYEFGKRFEFDLSLNNENSNGYSSLNQFELF